ncbi:uncharacterized protein TNCV_4894471 [Trichonephila clavipes]|nr:uncharacterized protein TNCV_4894471 [Trichonephila clavipes]
MVETRCGDNLMAEVGSKRKGYRDPKCPSARRIRMAPEDTRASSEGANCAWMAADEAIGCKRAFRSMWQSSRRMVYRVRLDSGLHVNVLSQIHWSQHLPSTQSERPY